MNTYNKVPEAPIKPLNETKKASSRRAKILKDFIPMLFTIGPTISDYSSLQILID